MTPANGTPTYSRLVMALHWTTVVLVFVAGAVGLWISDLGDDPLRSWGSRAHFVLGLLAGLVFLVRLAARMRMKPVAPLPLGEGHRRIVQIVDALLYGTGIAMVAAGIATSIASGWPAYLSGEVLTPPSFEDVGAREVHETLVFAFFGLVLVHVAGVLNHERLHGGALRRMLGRD